MGHPKSNSPPRVPRRRRLIIHPLPQQVLLHRLEHGVLVPGRAVRVAAVRHAKAGRPARVSGTGGLVVHPDPEEMLLGGFEEGVFVLGLRVGWEGGFDGVGFRVDGCRSAFAGEGRGGGEGGGFSGGGCR